MENKLNPCIYCGFDWKDYCSDGKKQECIELYKREEGPFAKIKRRDDE